MEQMKKNNLQKKISLLLLTLFLSLVSSCSNVPNVIGCIEISQSKGYCTYSMNGDGFYISDSEKYEGKTWFDMRNEMILIPIESWAKIKAYIIKTCRKMKCEVDEKVLDNVDRVLKKDLIE